MIVDLFHQAADEVAVPHETASRLWLAFQQQAGGESHYIPAPSSADRAQRDKDILAAWRSGESFAVLAMKHSITEVRVRQIVAKERSR